MSIGTPPDGYRAATLDPSKADRGQTKTRLEPDGLRGETVTLIAQWRYHEGIGYGAIADRPGLDPTACPLPQPTTYERPRGAWSKSSRAELLRNPKYTGYQIFNRRARAPEPGSTTTPARGCGPSSPPTSR